MAALLKQYPNASPIHSLSGAIKVTSKDFAGARTEYERALALDPKSIEALRGLTMVDPAQKNGTRARARLETELTSQPDRTELLALAANVYLREREFPKAEQVLHHLIDVDPSNMSGYSMLARRTWCSRNGCRPSGGPKNGFA